MHAFRGVKGTRSGDPGRGSGAALRRCVRNATLPRMDGITRSLSDSISHLFDNATAAIGAAISGMVAAFGNVLPPAVQPFAVIVLVVLVVLLVVFLIRR